jgi:hypothetical protein
MKATNEAQQPASERHEASPPAAAETVANGKTEWEARLESENKKLRHVVTKTAADKRELAAKLKAPATAPAAHPGPSQQAPAPAPAKRGGWLDSWTAPARTAPAANPAPAPASGPVTPQPPAIKKSWLSDW